MQKTLITVLTVILFSCNAEEKKDAGAKEEATVSSGASLPYTATYSSRFEIGVSKHAEALMDVWKSWDDGDLKTSRKYFADSMRFYFRDGSKMEGLTDSTLAAGQKFRDMYTMVKSTVHAVFPVKSTDKNDNWVCIWGDEVSTDKQGKTDSVHLQETWRFNKDGKIDLMYQFGRALLPTKTP